MLIDSLSAELQFHDTYKHLYKKRIIFKIENTQDGDHAKIKNNNFLRVKYNYKIVFLFGVNLLR